MRNARKPFPLRLPISVHGKATDFAQREGMSLNQFVTLAIAEKLTRLEQANEFRASRPDEEALTCPPLLCDGPQQFTSDKQQDTQPFDHPLSPSWFRNGRGDAGEQPD